MDGFIKDFTENVIVIIYFKDTVALKNMIEVLIKTQCEFLYV